MIRGRAVGVTELEVGSEGPASIRPITLRFVTAVGVDCDMLKVLDESRQRSFIRLTTFKDSFGRTAGIESRWLKGLKEEGSP